MTSPVELSLLVVYEITCSLLSIQPNAPKGSRAYLDGYRDEWREVFIITAEIYVFGALVFLILASGEKQPWADGPQESTKEQSTKSSSLTETESQHAWADGSYSCQ